MLVGYTRGSTADQSLELQTDALAAEGCEKLFTDVASGARTSCTLPASSCAANGLTNSPPPLVAHDGIGAFLAGFLLAVIIEGYQQLLEAIKFGGDAQPTATEATASSAAPNPISQGTLFD